MVANVAVAVRPLPVPIIVEAVAHNGEFAAGATPEVVVEGLRGLLRAINQADAFTGLIAETVGVEHLAEGFVLDPFHDLVPTFGGTALHAVLDDELIVLFSGFDELATFPDVVGDGLFYVDVLASLESPDTRKGVPVVGCGDNDGIEFLVFKEFSDVSVGIELGLRLGESFLLALQGNRIGVTNGSDTDAHAVFEAFEVSGMAGTLPPATDHANSHIRVRSLDTCPSGLEVGGDREA